MLLQGRAIEESAFRFPLFRVPHPSFLRVGLCRLYVLLLRKPP